MGLRQRLVALSDAKVSEYSDGEGEKGSVERLTAVVQARLWKMMQTKLYEEGAVKKLWRMDDNVDTASTTITEDEGGYEDLLGQNAAIENDGIADASRNFEDFVGEEFMDGDDDLFDDLLGENEEGGGDDGLLVYLEEQERMAVEAETDEMLFGPGCDDRRGEELEEDPLLLEDSSEEGMLL